MMEASTEHLNDLFDAIMRFEDALLMIFLARASRHVIAWAHFLTSLCSSVTEEQKTLFRGGTGAESGSTQRANCRQS